MPYPMCTCNHCMGGFMAHPVPSAGPNVSINDFIKYHENETKRFEKMLKKKEDEEKAKKDKDKKPEKWWQKKFTLFETFAVCLVLSIPLAIIEHGLIKFAYRVLTTQ